MTTDIITQTTIGFQIIRFYFSLFSYYLQRSGMGDGGESSLFFLLHLFRSARGLRQLQPFQQRLLQVRYVIEY